MLRPQLQQHLHNALHAGTVRSVDADVVLIVGQAGLVSAMRAESCLLAPQVHDTVLFVLLDDGSAWVLSVLRRNGGEEACLRLPKNTNLETHALRIKTAETEFEAESLRLQGARDQAHRAVCEPQRAFFGAEWADSHARLYGCAQLCAQPD